MSVDVLKAVRDKVISRLLPNSTPTIAWHAGEPTTAPISWYVHASEILRAACPGQTRFVMQSNGIAINDRWIELFRLTDTEVGLSIDGPQRFHDLRRRTRSGDPTWSLGIRGLRLLQNAGFSPAVITVLHPDGLAFAHEYYRFYCDHEITDVSFSIDELEGGNSTSGFMGREYKRDITNFLVTLLEHAFRDRYPLRIREIERVARILTGGELIDNEQVKPWDVLVVAANGNVSTFSPEFLEVNAPAYGNFIFGNILTGDIEEFSGKPIFRRTQAEVSEGTVACQSSCHYFEVCGGGAPVNKFCELGAVNGTETAFCRYTTQAAADALLKFIASHRSRGPDGAEFCKLTMDPH
jgi:uncharacterized protein